MHQCIKCDSKFKGSAEDLILNGCPQCGSKFFKYSPENRSKKLNKNKENSVETIMVKENGIYEVNLSSLMENNSVVVSDEEGKYLIDINFLLKKKLKEK